MKARRLLLGITALVVLVAVGIAIFVATFDAERYKPELRAWVKERTGRELAVAGPLRLTVLSGFGVSTGRMTLSNRDDPGTFATVESMRFSLALWPLLAGKVVIDDVRLDGLRIDLIKRADGKSNFDDLLGSPSNGRDEAVTPPVDSTAGAGFRIALGSLELEDAEVQWRDERNGTDLHATGVQASIGRIAPGASGEAKIAGRLAGVKPQLDLRISGEADYRLEKSGAIALTGLAARVQGDAAERRGIDGVLETDLEVDPSRSSFRIHELRLDARTQDGLEIAAHAPQLQISKEGAAGESANATLRLQTAERTLEAKLALSRLRGNAERMDFANLGLDARLKQGDASYTTELGGPLALDLGQSTAELPSVNGTLRLASPALGNQPLSGPVSGSLRASWAKPGSANAVLATTLEGSTLKATIDILDAARRAFRFAIDADRLDLDRYLPTTRAASAERGQGGSSTSEREPRPLVDFERLDDLDFSGTVRVGSLVARGVKLERLDLGMRAQRGRIEVSPLAVGLYGGTVTGKGWLDVRSRRWHVAQQINGVQVGPLLRATARPDRVEGRANATLDLDTSGETAEAMTRALQGTARFKLTDGAIKGVNLAELMRQASAALGSKASLEREARGGDRTDFSELAASFVIRDGVATTDDLAFRSDALRTTGGGRLDLASGAIDYKLNTTLVGVSADIRNRVIARLGEVTIPVRVTGTIEAPKYNVDLGSFAAGALGNELNRQLQRGAEGGGDPVKDLLRGLFRK